MASTKNGTFVWHELVTKDAKGAMAFYGEVVGWKTQPFGDGGEYTMWVGSQGPMGGVIEMPKEMEAMGAPPHWFGHVQVADVDATVALAKKMGGKVIKEPEDIPTVGRFGLIADPQGATLSVFTPSTEMASHDASKDGEFCWNELVTSDSTAAFAFYSALFGWKVREELDMGAMGKYLTYGVDETAIGGFMNVPPGATMPPSWIYYIEISNLDAAIGRATGLSAKVIFGPSEIPGGGRIAQLLDPRGVLFALHQAPAK